MARPRRNGDLPARRPEPLLWEKQPGESRVAFQNFAMFRDLGPHRSLSKAAEATGRSVNTLKEQSSKNRWQERADAYDDYLDRRLREERETEQARMQRTHYGAGAAMLSVALRRMNGASPGVGPNGEIVEGVERLDPNTLDGGDVQRLIESGVRVQRISIGLHTDFVKGSTAPSLSESIRVVSDVIEILSGFIPEERQARAQAELQAYIESGRRL